MQLTPFLLQLLCFAENTIKIVLSAKHSFCVSQMLTPIFYAHFINPFGEGGCIFGTVPNLSKFTILPICVVFLGFVRFSGGGPREAESCIFLFFSYFGAEDLNLFCSRPTGLQTLQRIFLCRRVILRTTFLPFQELEAAPLKKVQRPRANQELETVPPTS